MKKLLMLMAVIGLIFALGGCGGSNPQQSTQDGEAQSSTPEVQQTPSISAAPAPDGNAPASNFEEIMKSDHYLLHYKGTISFDGESIEADVTFATNGEDTFFRNVMGDMTAEILVKDGVTYQIDSAAKTYLAIYGADGTEDVLDTTDLEPTGTGTAEVFGKTLPYKEYTDGEEITRFYSEGEKLFAVELKGPDSESLMQVLELTGKVPAGMLDLPAGYTEAEGMAYPEDMEGYADEFLDEMEDDDSPDDQVSD